MGFELPVKLTGTSVFREVPVRASVPRGGADYESESAFSTPVPAESAVVDSSVFVCLSCSYVEHSFRFHRYHMPGHSSEKLE